MNIDGKEYGFDNNGLRAKNMVIYDGEKLYYFGNDYLRDKSEGWKNINGVYYYIDKDGGIVVNDWVEDNGKWYHFDTSGIMQVSTFIDDKYFVDENGEMVTNKSLVFGDTVYTFNNDGEFSKTIKKKKQKKNVKYKERYNNGSILIYNDYNVKDKSKKMICYCDGEEVNLNATISDNSFHFSFYLIGEELPSLNKEKKTFIKFENGETIPVFYTSNWYSVRFGAYTGITNEHNEIYEKLIALLQRDEDQKFEVSFDEVGLKLTGEICPGDFASVYAPYADKIMW